ITLEKQAIALLGFLDVPLCSPALCHIPKNEDRPQRAAITLDRGAAIINGNSPAVFGYQHSMIGQADREASPDHNVDGVIHVVTCLLVDDMENTAER